MKMISIKSACLTSLLCATTLANATPNREIFAIPAPIPLLKDGFYTGVQGGYMIGRQNHEFSTGALLFNTQGQITVAPAGPELGFFFGYGHYFSSLVYLGAEIFLNRGFTEEHRVNITNALFFYHAIGNYRGDFGIAIMPGLRVGPQTTAYVRVGSVTSALRNTEASDNHQLQHGLQVGAGLETLLCQNVSLRIQSVYNSYKTISLDSALLNTRITLNDLQTTVGLIYHFA